MSSRPRDSYTGSRSRDRDRNNCSYHDFYGRHHHSGYSNSDHHHNHHNPTRDRQHNSERRHNNIPHCNVNMYIQRRDYYHPTYNQYGAASNNYVRDTNINLLPRQDHNRERGYGDEHNYSRSHHTYNDHYDPDHSDIYRYEPSSKRPRYHYNDHHRRNDGYDNYSNNKHSTRESNRHASPEPKQSHKAQEECSKFTEKHTVSGYSQDFHRHSTTQNNASSQRMSNADTEVALGYF